MLNPRWTWVRITHKEKIQSSVSDAISRPYSIDEIFLRIRNEKKPQFPIVDKPPFEAENLNDSDVRLSDAKIPEGDDRYSYITAGGESFLLYGSEIWKNFQSIDSHVYEAMSRLSGENIKSIADLSHSFSQYQHDFWGEIPKALLDKWKGHLAEPYAATHFEQAGYHVDWPDHSNQPGWDLLVNGHEVNVKLVGNVSSLYEHFRKFPDIPAVVPGDLHLGAFSDHVFHFDPTQGLNDGFSEFLASSGHHSVIVDTALSSPDVQTQALDSAHAALGGSAAVHAHVPWITVATAGWREAKLLHGGKTDLKAAGTNLASDTVGRGGGALVGAKSGALLGSAIGSIFPGPGTAIGGAVGAAVGGVSGSLVGNKISIQFKRKPLDKAIESAQQAKSAFDELQRNVQAESEAKYSSEVQKQTANLEQIRMQENGFINQSHDRLKGQLSAKFQLSTEQTKVWFGEAMASLALEAKAVHDEVKNQGAWRRWIWPDLKTVTLVEIIAVNRKRSENLKKSFDEKLQSKLDVDCFEILDILSEYGILKNRVEEFVLECEEARNSYEESYRSQISRSYSTIIDARTLAFDKLSTMVNDLMASIRTKLSPLLDDFQEKLDLVYQEREKLGMSGAPLNTLPTTST